MSPVPLQAGLLRRALIGLAAVALAGCGGGQARRAQTVSPTPSAPTLQLTDCRQWRAMSQSSRRALVEQMTLFFGTRVDDQYGRGQTLAPERAFEVLTQACAPKFAGAYKLYKLYGRAAAFTP